MTKIYGIVAIILCIINIVVLEMCDDQKKRIKRQHEKIIALGIKLSEAEQEIERLSARLGAKENHNGNMKAEKEREAADAVRRYQRQQAVIGRIRQAYTERKAQ